MTTVKIDTQVLFELSPHLFMQFAEPLGTSDTSIDAAWDFFQKRWQPKALEMIKKLSPPMIRWGGCFSSYHHWKDAIGPYSQRKPMHNFCWDGIYLNEVGTAEIAELARTVNAEMLFCVNFESDGRKHWAYPRPGMDLCGSAEEAAEWVRYCNAADDALRKSHGFPEPFNVRYWQIGNETSYDERGFSSRENAVKAKYFAEKMRKSDPGIKLILWGDGPNEEWYTRYHEGKTSYWAEEVCNEAGEYGDYIAFHNHWSPPDIHGLEYRKNPDRTWERLLEGTGTFEERIIYMRNSVERFHKKLAITEAHMYIGGRHRGDVLSSWGAGLAYARCANILQRHGDVVVIATLADFFGNRWQNNAIMLPTPMWQNNPPYFLPVGTIMALFSSHIGNTALSATAPDGVDIAVSRTGDRCFVHAVNLQRHQSHILTFDIDGSSRMPSDIYEISADIMDEVNDMNPDIFAPKKVVPSADGKYILPASGVAVLEFQLENNPPKSIKKENKK